MVSFQSIFASLDPSKEFKSVEHAVFDYQIEPSDSTFAYIFLDVYRLALNMANKYSIIDNQDLVSSALASCYEAIMDYDCTALYYDNIGTAKFSTLFSLYLNRSLSSQLKSLNYDNRILNINADRYDIMIENGYDVEKDFDFSASEILSSLPNTLTDLEQKYCEIILKNSSVDDTDVALILNISNVSVTRMKKSLRKKLNFLAA